MISPILIVESKLYLKEATKSRPNRSTSFSKKWSAFLIGKQPFISNFTFNQEKRSNFPEKKMLAISLVFGSFLTVLFLIVGIGLGWVAREYMLSYQETPRMHPEFYDNHGNVIPDEVIAFRFENTDYEYDDTEDED